MKVSSTKSFLNMPCAHAQFFDKESDGSPGDCASLHGYDRSFHFKFTGVVDEMGWIYPFGELKEVKQWLEYYFDHTVVLPANDPRISSIPAGMTEQGGIIGTLRILPHGVSMEMSSIFVWEHVNAYIYKTSGGRVIVERIEIKEHERNSGMFETTYESAVNHAKRYLEYFDSFGTLPTHRYWDWESPYDALGRIKGWMN